jgi:hypothetical protein
LLLARKTYPSSAYYEDVLDADSPNGEETEMYIPNPEESGDSLIYCDIEGGDGSEVDTEIGCWPGCKLESEILDVFKAILYFREMGLQEEAVQKRRNMHKSASLCLQV